MRCSDKWDSDRPSKRRHTPKSSQIPVGPDAPSADEEYRVGPGHPPREFQFKRGVSGNPKGAKPKSKLLRDLRQLYARALNKKTKLRRGERDEIITKLEAGFDELGDQFAAGDRYARRDVFYYAEKLGIDLTASQGKGRHVDVSTEAELRQALLDRGIPARLLPPVDEVGLEPPPDPPLPADIEEEPNE
jgi:Family of unknown function (DUF5681)